LTKDQGQHRGSWLYSSPLARCVVNCDPCMFSMFGQTGASQARKWTAVQNFLTCGPLSGVLWHLKVHLVQQDILQLGGALCAVLQNLKLVWGSNIAP